MIESNMPSIIYEATTLSYAIAAMNDIEYDYRLSTFLATDSYLDFIPYLPNHIFMSSWYSLIVL